jgi:hypothetical protein
MAREGIRGEMFEVGTKILGGPTRRPSKFARQAGARDRNPLSNAFKSQVGREGGFRQLQESGPGLGPLVKREPGEKLRGCARARGWPICRVCGSLPHPHQGPGLVIVPASPGGGEATSGPRSTDTGAHFPARESPLPRLGWLPLDFGSHLSRSGSLSATP